jgi:phage gp36-like protein
MAYSTLDQLKERYRTQDITLYSDVAKAGITEPDPVTVAQAIADGDGWINSKIGVIYDVPLSTVPAEIEELSCRCAMHLLKRRAGKWDKEEEDAINKRLDAYANGTAVLTGVSTSTDTVAYGGYARMTEKTEDEYSDTTSAHPLDSFMEV